MRFAGEAIQREKLADSSLQHSSELHAEWMSPPNKPFRSTMTPASDLDPAEADESLLRLPALVRMTGLAKSTIYKHVALRQFPSPVSLVGRAVAWRLTEVVRWNRDRPAAGAKPKPPSVRGFRAAGTTSRPR